MRMLKPVHPGIFIKSEIIEAYGLTITDAAKLLQVSRPTLSTLLNGHASLSGEMATRMEQAFGVNMETLMRMQSAWDIAQTRQRGVFSSWSCIVWIWSRTTLSGGHRGAIMAASPPRRFIDHQQSHARKPANALHCGPK